MTLSEELVFEGSFLFKHRSNLPLIILVIGLIVYIQTILNIEEGAPGYIVPRYYQYICLGVSFFGLLIRIYTVGHTPKNTSGRNTSEGQVAEVLNKTGIYSIVRHPLYIGNFFMWLGVSMLTMNVWFIISFILLYWLYYERIMFVEEKFLGKKFGAVYAEWAKNVPACIPSFKNFKKPNESFSWKKILKNEKNGLFAIFVVFFLFEVTGEYITYNTFFEKGWLLYPTLASALLYFILKFLKHKTNVLKEEGR